MNFSAPGAPTTTSQHWHWFARQLRPTHTPPITCWRALRTDTDLAALARATHQLIERHEGLRTCFPTSDGIPYQRVLNANDDILEFCGIDDIFPDTAASDDALAHRAPAVAVANSIADTTQWDLTNEAPVRFLVADLGAAGRLFIAAFDHVIFDGYSQHLLWRDLEQLYYATRTGERPTLPSIDELQCRDYAYYQRRESERLKHNLEYWKELLGGDRPGRLVFPQQINRRLQYSSAKRVTASVRYGMQVRNKITEVAASLKCTPFTILRAALHLALFQMTRQQAFAMCIPASYRNRLNHQLIGSFIHATYPLAQIEEQLPTGRWLQILQQDILKSMQHSEYAQVELFRWMKQIDGDKADFLADTNPIMLNHAAHPPWKSPRHSNSPLWEDDFHSPLWEGDSQQVKIETDRPFSTIGGTPRRDLSMLISWETSDHLKLSAESNTNIFSGRDLEDFLVNFEVILKRLPICIETPLREVVGAKSVSMPDDTWRYRASRPVHLPSLSALVANHPDVETVVTRVADDGSQILCHVVAKEGLDGVELWEWIRGNLSGYPATIAPDALHVVPRSAVGSPCSNTCAIIPAHQQPILPPRTLHTKSGTRMLELLTAEFGPDFDISQSYSSLGGSAATAVKISLDMAEHGLKLPVKTLVAPVSVANILAAVDNWKVSEAISEILQINGFDPPKTTTMTQNQKSELA